MSDLHPADIEALTKVHAIRPVLQEHRRASDILNIDRNVLLHAGPAFASPSHITKVILNSASAALIFEGVARDFAEANQQIQSGDVILKPAQDHGVVVPLAGVVSASMWLHEVVDAAGTEIRSYSPLNGGNGPAMRLGQFSDDVVSHFHWLNNELIDVIETVRSRRTDLISIATQALTKGDDCHGRTIAATDTLLEAWRPQIEKFPRVNEFLIRSPMFFLNLWMAACQCMLAAAADTEQSSLVTVAGANGFEFGLQIAGKPGEWLTGQATPPQGNIGEYPPERALGAIGDSAIVDMAGFGAMALSLAPEQVKAFGSFVPDDALDLPQLLLPRIHTGFGSINLRVGLCARTVTETRQTPIVALGILDQEGVAGHLGGGIFRYPLVVFETACSDLR